LEEINSAISLRHNVNDSFLGLPFKYHFFFTFKSCYNWLINSWSRVWFWQFFSEGCKEVMECINTIKKKLVYLVGDYFKPDYIQEWSVDKRLEFFYYIFFTVSGLLQKIVLINYFFVKRPETVTITQGKMDNHKETIIVMEVLAVKTCRVEIRNGFKQLFALKSYVYWFAQNSWPRCL